MQFLSDLSEIRKPTMARMTLPSLSAQCRACIPAQFFGLVERCGCDKVYRYGAVVIAANPDRGWLLLRRRFSPL